MGFRLGHATMESGDVAELPFTDAVDSSDCVVWIEPVVAAPRPSPVAVVGASEEAGSVEEEEGVLPPINAARLPGVGKVVLIAVIRLLPGMSSGCRQGKQIGE